MPIEQTNLTAASNIDFTSFSANTHPEDHFPTRDAADNKLPIDDLFMHFTANVIQENKSFTR